MKVYNPRLKRQNARNKEQGLRFSCILCLAILCFVFRILPNIASAQTNNDMVDIKDALAIVSTAMGVKIVIDGDIKGQVPLELDSRSPRQIKDKLEKVLKENGFSWVSEGGMVRITRSSQRMWDSKLGRQLPLSYYIEIIGKNNLFRPLGAIATEVRSEFTLTGVFSFGENKRAIIEDIATRKSYYVSKGESVGSYQVFEISEDQVILTGPRGRILLKIQPK